MDVRNLERQDNIEQIIKVWKTDLLNTQTNKERTKSYINACLKSDMRNIFDNYEFFVIATVDNVIVGFGGILRKKDEFYLCRLNVLSNYRRLGVGSKIVHDLIDKFRDRYPGRILYASVDCNNSASLALLRKFGFCYCAAGKEISYYYLK